MRNDNPAFAQYRSEPEFLAGHPYLAVAWGRTRETLAAIRSAFAAGPLPDGVVTIYVCGSLGRMEQLPDSDCDLVIVTEDAIPPESPRAAEIYDAIWRRLEPLGLHRPKPDGIFSRTVTRGQLTDRATLGVVDEDQFVFGKRIQMLLDSQPVCADHAFELLARDVLERYALTTGRASLLTSSPWSGLVSDLARYFHSLRIRTTWWSDGDAGRWRTLNLKLRHSRLILYAGLLGLVAEASGDAASVSALLPRLALTPLERISRALHKTHDDRRRVLNAYDQFLRSMADPRVLHSLSDDALPVDAEHADFRRLIDSSRAISQVLSRWLISCGDDFLRETVFV